MSKTITVDRSESKRVDYKALIGDYIAQIDAIQQDIAKRQDHTERLQEETQEILERLRKE